MLLKNKIKLVIIPLLCMFLFGCDNQMPSGFSYWTTVVASIDGETVGLGDIPYTVRKKGEDDKFILEKKTDNSYHYKGDAGVTFFSEEPSFPLDYQYIVVDNEEELYNAQLNGTSPYYLVINDSSCEGYDTNYKTDVIVECKGFEPDNICDITKE